MTRACAHGSSTPQQGVRTRDTEDVRDADLNEPRRQVLAQRPHGSRRAAILRSTAPGLSSAANTRGEDIQYATAVARYQTPSTGEGAQIAARPRSADVYLASVLSQAASRGSRDAASGVVTYGIGNGHRMHRNRDLSWGVSKILGKSRGC